MTMRSPEPCPQNLAERSASFNRAEFNRTMRTKASNIASTCDVESLENLTIMNFSTRHVRHSSLDSLHGSALHPINLNSKFDNFFSSIWPAKHPAKIPVDQTDRENIVFSAPDNEEGGVETPEELILDPHESLFQDAHEESFSTSMSAESKSPREDMNFILWGNAAFCVSEAKDLLAGSKALGLHRQTDGSYGNVPKKQKSLLIDKSHHHAHSSEESPCSPASTRSSLLPSIGVPQDDHVALYTRNEVMDGDLPNKNLVCQNKEISKCQSSVGSTLSICKFSAQRHGQSQNLAVSSPQKLSMSSEAQSCCLDFDAQDIEASLSSDSKTPAYAHQETGSIQQRHNGNLEAVSSCNQQAGQVGGVAPFEVHKIAEQDASTASEEVKIRAELELEIEKDLEQELRTKIYLLSRRLEELRVLKANRHNKDEHDETQIEAGSSMPLTAKEGALVVKDSTEAPLPVSPKSKYGKSRALVEHRGSGFHGGDRTFTPPYLISNKKKLQNSDRDRLLSYSAAPLASWRTSAMASGSASHLKENGQQPCASDGGLQNTKLSKNSSEGGLSGRTKLPIEVIPKFQQEFQSWTGSSRAKKFDWIQTLRSDAACIPLVCLTKKGIEEASSFLLSAKEAVHGNVSRTLFSEESSSGPSTKKTVKTEKRERPMTPTAGNLKRSAFSSAKTNGDSVPSTPRIRKTSSGPIPQDTAIASVPLKRVASQKPAVNNHTLGLVQKILDPKQGKATTSNNSQAPAQQASSVKLVKMEQVNDAGNSTSSSRALKTVSSTHAEKLKRSASAPPSVPGRSVNSKDIKSALPKTLSNNKQVLSSRQIGGSRIAAPTTKPVTSSSQISKGRAGGQSESAIKKSGLTLVKPTGASRGKWY